MNTLAHAEEFQKLLSSYKPPARTKELLEHFRLVLFIAPSATGRNTIIRELLKTGKYHFITSHTTRDPRVNNGILEKNGREYWFRTEEEVLDKLRHGGFAEAALIHSQQVSGITIDELEKASQSHKVAITDIEVNGAEALHKLKPDITIVFMVPPSFDIWLERIHARGYMEPDEFTRRMQSAERELAVALFSDYYRFFLNDTVEGTTAEVDKFITTGYYDPFKERLVRETAEKLYHQVGQYLGQRS